MPSDVSIAGADQDPGRTVEELEQELSEARRRETATAEVLRVISRSQTDVAPVFATIVRSAVELCQAAYGFILRYDGEIISLVAHHNLSAEGLESLKNFWPMPARPESLVGRAVLERRIIHVRDILADKGYVFSALQKSLGYRTIATVPMLRGSAPIGAIAIYRTEMSPFSDHQVELLTTFADQAVIAIENTRLFEAEQASKRELQESLEYQTAISEVLGVISRSPSELQSVFDAIVTHTARLCDAAFSSVAMFGDGLLQLIAVNKMSPEETKAYHTVFPRPPGRHFIMGRAFVDRQVVHISDIEADPDYDPQTLATLKAAAPYRSFLGIPIIREGVPIGVIGCGRREVKPFTEAQIALAKSFADQAVIAIENTRLFEAEQARTRELSEALEQQTATANVLKAISRSTFDLPTVLNALVNSSARLCGADTAQILRPSGKEASYYSAATYGHTPAFDEYVKTITFHPGQGSVTGRILLDCKPVHIPDVLADPDYALHEAQQLGRFRTHLGVPLLREGTPIGVLILSRRTVQPFTIKQTELAISFADQAVIAIENVRLFEEIAQKSRELEIASQHKSQFVANMSHELRTPLAAILGYAELMQEGFYGTLSDKSTDALTRIRSNGKHLLGLINTVLDIAKIESGQFTLNMGEYDIQSIVETVRAATESLAQNKKLTLTTDVAKSLPFGLGDEQRLTQVLLNLVGNAIKFTDTGEVRIAAATANSHFTVTVTDTGPGIPEEHLARIFEQFHQVDNSNTKAKGGTGLGLAIAKEIVEMHGGRIWVESTVGKGATFQMELPVRTAAKGAA